MAYDIDKYPAQSGRVIGEDGQIYNLVDLLKNVGGGGMNPDDYYTKVEADNRFQPKGSYATTAQLNQLEGWIQSLEERVEALENGEENA